MICQVTQMRALVCSLAYPASYARHFLSPLPNPGQASATEINHWTGTVLVVGFPPQLVFLCSDSQIVFIVSSLKLIHFSTLFEHLQEMK